jgi:hypothetical protein
VATRQPAALPLVFRPAAALRVVCALTGALCLLAAVGNLVSFFQSGIVLRLVAALVLTAPGVLATGLIRRRIVVDTDTLAVTGLLRTLSVEWPAVLAIEQTRRSFVIITEQFDISAGWIAADRRDLLFRKVLEQAKLSLDAKEPRWGITARFVRRADPSVIPASQLLRPKSKQQEP